MDHAITIALEVCAIGMARLGITTASAFFLRESVRSLHIGILIGLSRDTKLSATRAANELLLFDGEPNTGHRPRLGEQTLPAG